MPHTSPKVLFVCTGNTCRSPMAEGLMWAAAENPEDFQISSAGVAANNGAPASIETRNVLLDHGIDFTSFRSQQVTTEMVKEADYVFCMSRMHRMAILNTVPELREKVLCLGEFLGEEESVDIADPFGLGEPAYRVVEEQLHVAIVNLIAFIQEQPSLEEDLES